VRLETEREAFLTTPEHPFATSHSGWIRAGRLVPGDWVVSERFGAVRLLSVRSEPAARPVPVFNLSVASSHAYFVGTNRVLVHNTNCQPNEGESREDFIARLVRMRDETNRQIKELTKTTPTTPQIQARIAQLKKERRQLQVRIDVLRKAQRDEQGVAPPSRDDHSRKYFEAEREIARKALEDARKALADLESRPPATEDEETSFAARRAELEKEVSSLTLTDDRMNLIQTLFRELAELENHVPATDAERRALEEEKKELRANLDLQRKRARDLLRVRRKRTDPEWRKEIAQYKRDQHAHRLRTRTHLANPSRPRDALERLEDELAGLLQAPPSERRDARIDHLRSQIDTKKRLVEVRRELDRVKRKRNRALLARKKRIAEGQDTSKLDEEIGLAEPVLRANRIEIAQLRVRERLLNQPDEALWPHAPGSVDEPQLREFQRQLDEGVVNDQQLAEIERALDATDPTNADWEQAVVEEADDVDETFREWEALLNENPSAERTARLQSSFERLRQELREERVAVEAAVFALANESAFIQTTQAGSSSGPTWQDRLRAIHQEQLHLRADWRARLEARLESARERLNLLRLAAPRNAAVEAELAREIALLEGELQKAGG
jgi:hypothetical protein